LHVGEERIVSEEGLLPLAQTGLQTIDKIIRIHAEDPFKSQAVYEYTEYYHDASGIQIAGYEANPKDAMIVSGVIAQDATGTYTVTPEQADGRDQYGLVADESHFPNGGISYNESTPAWNLVFVDDATPANVSLWTAIGDVATPDLATTWAPSFNATGTPVVTAGTTYSAFITYLAGIPATYGDGEGEESDVPEPWFEYMAQGAYTDWLRSDGQTEKAMAEEAIAADLLNQQLEKVSRSNGNQVITRVMSHATKQAR
jgi:hypothetical protein